MYTADALPVEPLLDYVLRVSPIGGTLMRLSLTRVLQPLSISMLWSTQVFKGEVSQTTMWFG